LREHPVGNSVVEVIERHDRGRFDVLGFSYGADDSSAIRGRLVKAFDAFQDVGSLSDGESADAIAGNDLDILIDLTGYTTNTRLSILALRPAPIQVSWLGYPGTLGHARLADYIIGDPVVTPRDHSKFFSEKLALMPDCCLPYDRKREIAKTPARADVGLPEHGFVFCCFNQAFKITPVIYDLWCRLLDKLPGSILWLAQPTRAAHENLVREAVARGIAADRLVFAPRLPSIADHLARYRVADLALDTHPYTSHTTAVDILWAGLPLITLQGDTFAGRVASSVLHAAELEELVTGSPDAYLNLAHEVSANPRRLAELRERLGRNRSTCALFDIDRFVRNFDELIEELYAHHRSGKTSVVAVDTDGNTVD